MSTTGKVQLKLPPWVAIMLNEQGSGWFIFEKEIGEGATIGDLLEDLALNYTNFRKVVFNPDVGKVSDQVNVVLNDRLLQLPDVTEVKFNDGDSIIILLVYTGG